MRNDSFKNIFRTLDFAIKNWKIKLGYVIVNTTLFSGLISFTSRTLIWLIVQFLLRTLTFNLTLCQSATAYIPVNMNFMWYYCTENHKNFPFLLISVFINMNFRLSLKICRLAVMRIKIFNNGTEARLFLKHYMLVQKTETGTKNKNWTFLSKWLNILESG